MAGIERYVMRTAGVIVMLTAVSVARGDGPALLRDVGPPDGATLVRVGMKADGLYRHALPPGSEKSEKAEAPKPLALRVQTRLEFLERVVKRDANGMPLRSVRRAVRAGSAVNVEKKPHPGGDRVVVTLDGKFLAYEWNEATE